MLDEVERCKEAGWDGNGLESSCASGEVVVESGADERGEESSGEDVVGVSFPR